MTTLHEVAHLLHQQIFSERNGEYSTLESTRRLFEDLNLKLYTQFNTGWYTAAEEDAIRAKFNTVGAMKELLQALGDTPEVSMLKKVTKGDFADDAANASRNTEIFARAYAQYIAQKSQDPILLVQLDNERSRFLKKYWSDENFKPVAKAFDTLFDTKGWLTNRTPN